MFLPFHMWIKRTADVLLFKWYTRNDRNNCDFSGKMTT